MAVSVRSGEWRLVVYVVVSDQSVNLAFNCVSIVINLGCRPKIIAAVSTSLSLYRSLYQYIYIYTYIYMYTYKERKYMYIY